MRGAHKEYHLRLSISREAEHMAWILAAGTVAPNFTLRVTPDQNLTLSDLRGRPVILAFYPADWSPVCGDQMTLYNEILPEFHKHDAELLGISVDGAWCHVFCARPSPAFSAALRFRAQGRGRKDIRRLSYQRGRRGTCAVCARPAGHDCVELLLPDRGQSWRRWNSRCSRTTPRSGKQSWPP